MTQANQDRWGLIAGNGRFPFLVLEAARSQGIEMTVIGLREETFPEIEQQATRMHWVSLGELSHALDILRQERLNKVVMAGQVKHKQIFSSIPADGFLARLLGSLPVKSTDMLIGAVTRVLQQAGIEVVDSTLFLKPLLPEPGVLTARKPDAREMADIEYGRRIAREIARLDLGQTVVVCDRACVAIEAMEGTDETIERAGRLVQLGRLGPRKPESGETGLVVVKVSKPGQDMRFDVPVVGKPTIEVMQRAHATALAINAHRTLLLDRTQMIAAANQAGIAVQAFPPQD